jgi:hypothetical protein
MTTRPTRPTAIFTASAALSLALGAAVLASSLPARAEDDGVPIDTKIMRSIMSGLGLKRDGEPGIDYSERAPLVLPPSRTLPPPEADATTKNPNWPVDPDIKRAKEIDAAERSSGYGSSTKMDEDARPLRPDQLNVGPRRNSSRDVSAMSPEESARPFKPSALGSNGSLWNTMFGSKDSEGTAKFTREPARTSLTEPPPGYQTPSAAQPYGEAKADSAPKAGNATDQRIEAATK